MVVGEEEVNEEEEGEYRADTNCVRLVSEINTIAMDMMNVRTPCHIASVLHFP